MNLASLTQEQKENLFLTYDATKYCLFCKEKFGFTFITAFKDSLSLNEAVSLYNLRPSMDQGAGMRYMQETGAFL